MILPIRCPPVGARLAGVFIAAEVDAIFLACDSRCSVNEDLRCKLRAIKVSVSLQLTVYRARLISRFAISRHTDFVFGSRGE